MNTSTRDTPPDLRPRRDRATVDAVRWLKRWKLLGGAVSDEDISLVWQGGRHEELVLQARMEINALFAAQEAMWDRRLHEVLAHIDRVGTIRLPYKNGSWVDYALGATRKALDHYGAATFGVDEFERARFIGYCNFKARVITWSPRQVLMCPPEKLEPIILHEVAHALCEDVDRFNSHGPRWQAVARRIGGRLSP